jgi:prephenate dehydratase
VGFQGELGAYSDEAAQRLFPDVETVGLATFSEVFQALDANELTAAVLPVENSTAGVVQEVSDLLWSYQKIHVVGEHVSPIRHHLLAATSGDVTRSLSHPQALAQCATWLRDHDIEPVPFYDTAGAAKEISLNPRQGDAAIASSAAAGRYGLKIVARDIADSHNNQTRFLVLVTDGKQSHIQGDVRKLILGFTTKHRPGALSQVMAVFSAHEANLTRLDSRPVPDQPFSYRFYADAELDDQDNEESLLLDLRAVTLDFRLFGAFDHQR